MTRILRIVSLALLAAVLLPAAVHAQASIAGSVKDSSGAILPGATVEVASPALIEKVRSATSDSNGRYQIVDLRPGEYSVTFTLTGFSSVKREGVSLSGAQTLTLDAELRVGSLTETVTVTGESAILDVQSATRETVLNREVVQALPTGRNYYALGGVITGINVTSNSGVDVGGSLGDTMASLMAHGSRAGDQRITNNGINVSTLESGGNSGGATPDVSAAQEVTVDTSAVSADQPTGGVRVNMIPRDGGNRFASSSFFTFTTESFEGS
ncbi:MAG: carboxypeptidase-like regulatory domain-containing protein, partial [Acidobacteriota bacterium]